MFTKKKQDKYADFININIGQILEFTHPSSEDDADRAMERLLADVDLILGDDKCGQ